MITTFAALPANLPWHSGCHLLLDAVAMPELALQMTSCRPEGSFAHLYQGSELEALEDLSPCLITLGGSDDALLHNAMTDAERPWGYLLFGNISLETLAIHLRWLLFARWGTERCFLRIADPVTAHHLFSDATHVLGPIESACIPDHALRSWHHHTPHADAPAIDHERPFQLTELELKALERARMLQCADLLDAHLRRFFPSFGQAITLHTRQQHLLRLVAEADRLGLQSLQQLCLLTNLMALYAEAQPQRLSEFPALLANTPDLASATNLARQLSLRTEPG